MGTTVRVIAGELRSRLLVTPRGTGTRPTSDRLRETMFNVLAPRIEGARFLDLYAGSGAVGVEALSRGASFCVLAERAPAALAAIRGNLAALGLAGKVTVEARAVARVLAEAGRQKPFDLVFLDPPYGAAEEYTATLSALAEHRDALLAPGALVVAEHARRSGPAESFGLLRRIRLLEQGDAALSIYRIDDDSG